MTHKPLPHHLDDKELVPRRRRVTGARVMLAIIVFILAVRLVWRVLQMTP
jgi:hypothetical protein